MRNSGAGNREIGRKSGEKNDVDDRDEKQRDGERASDEDIDPSGNKRRKRSAEGRPGGEPDRTIPRSDGDDISAGNRGRDGEVEPGGGGGGGGGGDFDADDCKKGRKRRRRRGPKKEKDKEKRRKPEIVTKSGVGRIERGGPSGGGDG